VAAILQAEVPFGELGRNLLERLGEVEGQFLLAELLHQLVFSSTRMSSPL
jgi:hypothetical protein